MSDCVTFHTQLAYILDVLANKALEEICKVVDDGYALLRFEVSRHQKENDALKRKLQMMELRAERTESDLVQVCHALKGSGADERRFPATERVFGQQICVRRDEEPAAVDEEETPVSVVTKDEEGRPELIVIKEERPEDERRASGSQAVAEISPPGAVGSRAGGGGRPPVQETQNKAENHTEEFTEQHRTRHGVWELASVMEVLANAAVAEICKLVDDGYAVLRLEVSESRKENKVLKRKLQLMESRVGRGCAARDVSASSRPDRATGCRTSRPAARDEGHFSAAERIFGKQLLDAGLMRDGEADVTSVDEDDAPTHNVMTWDECADMEEGRTESLPVKEEAHEEEGDPRKGPAFPGQRVVDLAADGGKRSPTADAQTRPAKHTEELTEQHRTRHGVWECAGVEEGRTESLLIKEERLEEDSDPQGEMNAREERVADCGAQAGEGASRPEELGEPRRSACGVWEVGGLEAVLGGGGETSGGSKARAERLGGLFSEYGTYEGPAGQSRTFFSRGRGRRLACPYGSSAESEGLLRGTEALSPLAPLDWKAEPASIASGMCPPRQHSEKTRSRTRTPWM
ncbi:hypothetical protein AAFF_G00265400 [Aldrovandia affinis]|uniref:Uncharacterized protein n=1 Tax=Aldrovandia affinis TaxID=143900 RepID=A0AAD7W2M2_9TELE|nr:hypothetical protein AAFF_G00265400 [Aldrovandia affinis]